MPHLGWGGIVRLGLVQAGLGSIVVLTTSTLNRVMVVELALPALIPGLLVGLHYVLQVLRPRLGYGSDVGGRRTPWILGGMAVLAVGGTLAACGTALMASHLAAGMAVTVAAFVLVGLGVGACGTALLTLLAKRADPRHRAPAATIVWLMMIFGIAVTATVAGKLLDPFSIERLVGVTAAVSAIAFAATALAVWGIEGAVDAAPPAPAESGGAFLPALREIWAEPQARRFAIFVFVSMLAYSAQDLVMEPFAGAVFGMTPGETTALTGLHHAGLLIGMGLVAVFGLLSGGFRTGAMRGFTIGGCVGSAVAIALLAASGFGLDWPIRGGVVVLGVANGAFAIAAIGAMMGLASNGRSGREGTRMGLWGAAQALAFGAGGLMSTGVADLAHRVFGGPAPAYAAAFLIEAALFLLSAVLAIGVFQTRRISQAPMGANAIQAS
ncbi:MAG: BCD family MFS transporter [Gemmatimonadaceae bacterium]|nr:BCD family MFS transporter [Acetobacteraceae bacterium]